MDDGQRFSSQIGMQQQEKICVNGQQSRGRDRVRYFKENKDRWGPIEGQRIEKRAGDHSSGQKVRWQRLDTVEESLIHLVASGPSLGPFV